MILFMLGVALSYLVVAAYIVWLARRYNAMTRRAVPRFPIARVVRDRRLDISTAQKGWLR